MPVEPKANKKYYYSDDDITALSSKYEVDKYNPKIKWAAPTSIDTIGLLKGSFNELTKGDQLLVPIKHNQHWFGAIFEASAVKGLGYKVTWLDSLKKQDPQNKQRDEILETFTKKLNTAISIKEQNTFSPKQQNDQSSCGPWVIENLKYASDYNSVVPDAQQRVLDEYNTLNENNIRSSHIEILGDKFAKKQLQNNRLDTDIDQSKLNAFKGDVYSIQSMKDLANKISTTATLEYKDALSDFASASSWEQTPENQVIKKSALDQMKKIDSGNSFTEQIKANKDKKGYLTSLNEYAKYYGSRDVSNPARTNPNSAEHSDPIVSNPVFKGANDEDKVKMIFLARGVNAAPKEYRNQLGALAEVSPAISPNDLEVAWNQFKTKFPNQSYLNDNIEHERHKEGYLYNLNKFINSPELSAENTRANSKLSANKAVETKTIDDLHLDLAKEIHKSSFQDQNLKVALETYAAGAKFFESDREREHNWNQILKTFYPDFNKSTDKNTKSILNNVSKNINKINFGTLDLYLDGLKSEDTIKAEKVVAKTKENTPSKSGWPPYGLRQVPTGRTR